MLWSATIMLLSRRTTPQLDAKVYSGIDLDHPVYDTDHLAKVLAYAAVDALYPLGEIHRP